MATTSRIQVFDTTLRDGEQAPGFSMTAAGEAAAGAAARSPRRGHHRGRLPDFVGRRLRGGAHHCRRRAPADHRGPGARHSRRHRSRLGGAVAGAARPRIHVFLATSDIHLEHKLRITRAQCLAQIASAVAHARALLRRRRVLGGGCDPQRSRHSCARWPSRRRRRRRDHDQPARYRRLRAAGRHRADVHDRRRALHRRTRRALGALPQRSRHGRRQLAGRRAGRRAAGRMHHQRHRRTRRQCLARRDRDGDRSAGRRAAAPHRHPHARRWCPTSNTLSAIVGVSVPPNKAIVGANAFAHEAGIHQDGMLKHELTYEIMRPESVGAPGTRLVLGKHSGMRGLDARCRALGHRLRQPELERLYIGHGPRRSHQVGRRRSAGGHHSRRAGDRRWRWAPPPHPRRGDVTCH